MRYKIVMIKLVMVVEVVLNYVWAHIFRNLLLIIVLKKKNKLYLLYDRKIVFNTTMHVHKHRHQLGRGNVPRLYP